MAHAIGVRAAQRSPTPLEMEEVKDNDTQPAGEHRGAIPSNSPQRKEGGDSVGPSSAPRGDLNVENNPSGSHPGVNADSVGQQHIVEGLDHPLEPPAPNEPPEEDQENALPPLPSPSHSLSCWAFVKTKAAESNDIARTVLMYSISSACFGLAVNIPVYFKCYMPFQKVQYNTTATNTTATNTTAIHMKMSQLSDSQRYTYVAGLVLDNVMAMALIARITWECMKALPPKVRDWGNTLTICLFWVASGCMTVPFFITSGSTQQVWDTVNSILQVMAIIFFISFFVVDYWAIHLTTKHPGSKWWHIPFCCLCFCLECVIVIILANSPFGYVQSKWFPWTSPFIFGISSFLTRRAAEIALGLPLEAASRLSTISLGLGVLFTRFGQSNQIDDVDQVIYLEIYYGVLQMILRASLYSRHAVCSSCSDDPVGTVQFRVAPRNARAQAISSMSNRTECVYDTSSFLTTYTLRYVTLPSKITFGEFVGTTLFCVSFQYLNNIATFLVISYVEMIPLKAFRIPSATLGEIFTAMSYYVIGAIFGPWFFGLVALNLWDSTYNTKSMSV